MRQYKRHGTLQPYISYYDEFNLENKISELKNEIEKYKYYYNDIALVDEAINAMDTINKMSCSEREAFYKSIYNIREYEHYGNITQYKILKEEYYRLNRMMRIIYDEYMVKLLEVVSSASVHVAVYIDNTYILYYKDKECDHKVICEDRDYLPCYNEVCDDSLMEIFNEYLDFISTRFSEEPYDIYGYKPTRFSDSHKLPFKNKLPDEVKENLYTKKQWQEQGFYCKPDAKEFLMHPNAHPSGSYNICSYYHRNDVEHI